MLRVKLSSKLVYLYSQNIGDEFTVVYDTLEDIKAGKATPVSPNGASYNGIDPTTMAAMLGIAVVEGAVKIPLNNRLNERYPEIKPMRLEHLLKMAWSK